MSDAAESGQALAAAALQDPTGPSRDRLIEMIRPRLHARATSLLRDRPDLNAEDLVQDFLIKKVLPPAKLHVFFGPVAAGKCKLWPRLSLSLDNFHISWARRPSRLPVQCPAGSGENEYNPGDAEGGTDLFATIVERVAAQIAAIRTAFPTPESGVPFGAALLLEERLRLTERVAASYAPEDGKTVGNQTIRELVEGIADWKGETARTFPQISLSDAWIAVLERTEERPQEADSCLVAAVLDITQDGWHQWVTRGRRRLAQRLGSDEARRLFSTWPAGVFESASPHEGRP